MTGGPLPDDQLQQFPLSASRLPGEEGDAAEFRIIQGCEGGGETAWIQSTPGQRRGAGNIRPDRDADRRAAEGGHDHMAAEHESTEAASESSTTTPATSSAIAALDHRRARPTIVGSVALVSSRRKGCRHEEKSEVSSSPLAASFATPVFAGVAYRLFGDRP